MLISVSTEHQSMSENCFHLYITICGKFVSNQGYIRSKGILIDFHLQSMQETISNENNTNKNLTFTHAR